MTDTATNFLESVPKKVLHIDRNPAPRAPVNASEAKLERGGDGVTPLYLHLLPNTCMAKPRNHEASLAAKIIALVPQDMRR